MSGEMLVSAEAVDLLRKRTGAGLMDCKSALVKTGDMALAEEYLTRTGLAAVMSERARYPKCYDELEKSKANEAKLRECVEEIALTGNLSITDAQDMARRTLTEIDREETKPC